MSSRVKHIASHARAELASMDLVAGYLAQHGDDDLWARTAHTDELAQITSTKRKASLRQ